MNYTLAFHPFAKEEYIDAYIWYEAIQEGLGLRFRECVEARLEQIRENPARYSTKNNPKYREAKIANFPYMIVYELFPQKGIIHITAIIHGSRNTKHRYRRLK